MRPYHEEAVLTDYVLDHYSQFNTDVENKAGWVAYFVVGNKLDTEAMIKLAHSRWRAVDGAVVAELLKDGVESYRWRTAQRILREHGDEVFVNRCGRCDRIVRTPKARQCFWCGFDWHAVRHRPSAVSGTRRAEDEL